MQTDDLHYKGLSTATPGSFLSSSADPGSDQSISLQLNISLPKCSFTLHKYSCHFTLAAWCVRVKIDQLVDESE